MLGFVNVLYAAACLARIEKITTARSTDLDDHHKDVIEGQYLQELFLTYRNLMMNVCSLILQFCLMVCTW